MFIYTYERVLAITCVYKCLWAKKKIKKITYTEYQEINEHIEKEKCAEAYNTDVVISTSKKRLRIFSWRNAKYSANKIKIKKNILSLATAKRFLVWLHIPIYFLGSVTTWHLLLILVVASEAGLPTSVVPFLLWSPACVEQETFHCLSKWDDPEASWVIKKKDVNETIFFSSLFKERYTHQVICLSKGRKKKMEICSIPFMDT